MELLFQGVLDGAIAGIDVAEYCRGDFVVFGGGVGGGGLFGVVVFGGGVGGGTSVVLIVISSNPVGLFTATPAA